MLPYRTRRQSETRFGDAVLLAIRDSEDPLLKVFLPQRYGAAFKGDLQAINEGAVHWNIVSKGRSPGTTAYQLAIE